MDVQCERCKTEYEFDDALVSGRGTTVKCTNCGFQFKIRKAGEASAGQLASSDQDRWTVRTIEGRDIVFTSLRELQRAILAKQVGRSDALTRGNGPARALGAIAELEPFFDEKKGVSLTPPPPATALGLAPPRPASTSPAPPVVTGTGAVTRTGAPPPPKVDPRKTMIGYGGSAPPPMRDKMPSRPPPPPGAKRTTLRPIAPGPSPSPSQVDSGELAPESWIQPAPPSSVASGEMRPRIDTIRPPSAANAAVPPPPPRPFAIPEDSGARPPPKPLVYENTPPMPTHADRFNDQSSVRPGSLPPPSIDPIGTETGMESGLPPPTNPVRKIDDDAPRRMAMSSLGESDSVEIPRHPRRVGGWIVALVLLGGAGLIGYVVAKPYLANMSKPAASAAAPLDPRAQQFLNEGEKALTEGNLDAAKENFDKASALAETDARVLLDLARLASARADVPWLRSRILPADATDDAASTKASLDELGAKARKTADDALAAAPEDPAAIRAKIDAARIVGDRTAARALVTKIIGNASQPETAYVLAALDLAEPEPLWPMVVERLKLAAAGEGSAGRARAALVYALAASGDVAGAKQEIDRLAALSRPYPLLGALKAFTAKTPVAKGAADAGAATKAATVDVSTLPRPSAGSGGGGGGAAAGDTRNLVAQAAAAEQAHDYDRAKALYSAAIAHNSSDSEALAGLGDVAHATRDLTSAIGYYRRALAVNPVYLPALIGQGDALWESGDKAGAQKVYRDIEDRFPDGTYPPRVKQRGESSAPPPATTGTTPSTEAPAADDKGASQ